MIRVQFQTFVRSEEFNRNVFVFPFWRDKKVISVFLEENIGTLKLAILLVHRHLTE